MRALLNTLYITTPDTYLSINGENIIINQNNKVVGKRPLHNIESIVSYGRSGASPRLMGACAEKNISICFMNEYGRFLARVTGEQNGNVFLRKKQYKISENEEASNLIARNIILGKVYNQKWVIERAIRDYSMRLDENKLKNVSGNLSKLLVKIRNCDNLDILRGYEGEAASQYFQVFDDLILQQKEDFFFKTRNKRPPLDNVNSMLSFLYTVLSNDVQSALETVGLDPFVGFLHRDRAGRAGLALDLMEEFRAVLVDRLILTLINKKIVTGDGFEKREDGAVTISENTRKKILTEWQKRKMEVSIKHPFLNQKIEWGLVPYVQAKLLSRYLREDLDEYPPFLWK